MSRNRVGAGWLLGFPCAAIQVLLSILRRIKSQQSLEAMSEWSFDEHSKQEGRLAKVELELPVALSVGIDEADA